MPFPDRPLRIAGAGPSGLACAIALAEAGREVELCELRTRVGGRFAGDHQVLPGFGEAPRGPQLLASVGLRPGDLEWTPLHRARFLDGRGSVRELRSREPYAYLLRRGPDPGTLDHALQVRARTLGVTVRTGCRLRPEEADVWATGAAAVDGMALERLFRTDAPDRIDVLFDPALTPGGYAYLFVREGRATAGAAALGDYRHLEAMLEAALERFHRLEPFDQREARRSANRMNFTLPATAVQDGRLYLGEAAGFQDYLFGLGMRGALISGQLAARALVERIDYDALWRERLEGRLRASLADRWLYEHLPSWLLLRLLAGGDLRERLDRFQADGWWKRGIGAWARWRWLRPDASGCRHNLPGHRCRTGGFDGASSWAELGEERA